MDSRAQVSRVQVDLDVVINVASKSPDLKGTYVRVLRDAARSIRSVTEALASRTKSRENEVLEANNDRLKREVDTLKMVVGELRGTIEGLRGGEWRLPSLDSSPPTDLDPMMDLEEAGTPPVIDITSGQVDPTSSKEVDAHGNGRDQRRCSRPHNGCDYIAGREYNKCPLCSNKGATAP